MPRSYVPTLLALQLPGLLLVLGIGGRWARLSSLPCERGGGAGYRAALLATVLAATLPILITVAARPAMYNGIRHFVFTLPPFAVLGGLAGCLDRPGLNGTASRRGCAGADGVAGIASPVVAMVRLHPYEYTYFNRFAGGVAGARPRYMLDYWGLSLTQASRQLRTLH